MTMTKLKLVLTAVAAITVVTPAKAYGFWPLRPVPYYSHYYHPAYPAPYYHPVYPAPIYVPPPPPMPLYNYAAPFVPAPPDPFVLWVQRSLNSLAIGAYLLEDGVIGIQTTSAVASYQAQHGLPATGFADTATVSLLSAQTAPLVGPPPQVHVAPTAHLGPPGTLTDPGYDQVIRDGQGHEIGHNHVEPRHQ